MKPAKPASATMNEQTFVPATMRAVYYSNIVTGNEYSPAANVRQNNRELDAGLAAGALLDTDYLSPRPSAHQYLLKIQAATWGHMEAPPTRVVSQRYASTRVPLHNVCGTVISTPTEDHMKPGGPQFKIGDAVFGMLSFTRDGGAADYALATEDELSLKPMNISAAEAASVVTPALVIKQALSRYFATPVPATSDGKGPTSLKPLHVLVINGDDSKIGRIAVQLLRAETATLAFARPWICAVCERHGSEAFKRESGVDEILVSPPSPNQTVDLAATFHAREWGTADIILDFSIGATSQLARASSVLKNNGLVIALRMPCPKVESTVSRGQDILCPDDSVVRFRYVAASPDGVALAQIAELIEGNKITIGETTIIDLVDASNFITTGFKEAPSRLADDEVVVRVN
ncbi:Alcohol dehydrogenase superfamily, zinc-type [Penicillium italicum]|uniref:Alcohol dehydrogenase superfamily, zinc-type n=1 Tax=Penicillium italicum TaxID=40296 RepID=A0A0A2KT87_PENIT|nr:Alcohol dehydrogenase superfamily, zinc-type [Penicillium italicum]